MSVLGTRPALARQRVSGAMKMRLASCKSPMRMGSRSRSCSVMDQRLALVHQPVFGGRGFVDGFKDAREIERVVLAQRRGDGLDCKFAPAPGPLPGAAAPQSAARENLQAFSADPYSPR